MVNKRVKFALWWRNSGMGVRLFLFVALGTLISLLVYWQRPDEDTTQIGSNLTIFFLVNLIIVILFVLAFLIGRNVVKLIFDRKRNILGSKLRMRLVLAFVSLTLVPNIIIFFLASGLLSNAMEGWFSSQVESAVGSSVEVVKQHHQWLKEYVDTAARGITEKIPERGGAGVDAMLERIRQEKSLFSIHIYDRSGNPLAVQQSAAAVIDNFGEPGPNRLALERALKGEAVILSEEKAAGQFVRAYRPLRFRNSDDVLMVTMRVSPEIVHALNIVNDSYKEYEQIKLFRNPLKSAYILTLTMITGLLLFSAIWFGFYIAREISGPVQRLAEGTRAVARGNYDFQIREMGDDEMSFLVKSFNTMTSDLKHSRAESERRRVYIESILSHLAVGVIAIDPDGNVTEINPAAARLCGVTDMLAAPGRSLQEVLGEETFRQVEPLLNRREGSAGEGQEPPAEEKEISLIAAGREIKIVCTAGEILGADRRLLAKVLIFDDITELAKAQHMSAWREVARRIAHEIKNPLTPIQLSAQRLQKLLGDANPLPAVTESTQTIIENVDSIKRLANEFSNFARMPTAEFRPGDLNLLISDTIAPFAEDQTSIVFQFVADNKLPEVLMDAEQIRRILINLIDNAIGAIERDDHRPADAEGPRIVIKTVYDRKSKNVTIEVADNGPGIRDSEKIRVFEPYYTTKSGGTGLGLAIVTSIVADHQGDIKVYDNRPRGAKFLVDLPLAPKSQTQRRFSAT